MQGTDLRSAELGRLKALSIRGLSIDRSLGIDRSLSIDRGLSMRTAGNNDKAVHAAFQRNNCQSFKRASNQW